jgi:type III secretion protein J
MRLSRWLLPLALLALTGCNKVNLYSQLSEQQANEIVAALLSARIDADKELADGKTWVVKTDKADLPLAVDVLRRTGYPREQFQSFGDIFKKNGFVSSPMEERARLIHGLSQELAHTLTSIDGVIAARVHVAVPEKDGLSDKVRPSSASIFIKYRPDVDIASHVPQIKALVVNSIEGLPYDNVTVTLFAGERVVPAQPHEQPTAGVVALPPWLYLGGAAAAVLTLGGFAFASWRLWRKPGDVAAAPARA